MSLGLHAVRLLSAPDSSFQANTLQTTNKRKIVRTLKSVGDLRTHWQRSGIMQERSVTTLGYPPGAAHTPGELLKGKDQKAKGEACQQPTVHRDCITPRLPWAKPLPLRIHASLRGKQIGFPSGEGIPSSSMDGEGICWV